jgi:hypothetical protein
MFIMFLRIVCIKQLIAGWRILFQSELVDNTYKLDSVENPIGGHKLQGSKI